MTVNNDITYPIIKVTDENINNKNFLVYTKQCV